LAQLTEPRFCALVWIAVGLATASAAPMAVYVAMPSPSHLGAGSHPADRVDPGQPCFGQAMVAGWCIGMSPQYFNMAWTHGQCTPECSEEKQFTESHQPPVPMWQVQQNMAPTHQQQQSLASPAHQQPQSTHPAAQIFQHHGQELWPPQQVCQQQQQQQSLAQGHQRPQQQYPEHVQMAAIVVPMSMLVPSFASPHASGQVPLQIAPTLSEPPTHAAPPAEPSEPECLMHGDILQERRLAVPQRGGCFERNPMDTGLSLDVSAQASSHARSEHTRRGRRGRGKPVTPASKTLGTSAAGARALHTFGTASTIDSLSPTSSCRTSEQDGSQPDPGSDAESASTAVPDREFFEEFAHLLSGRDAEAVLQRQEQTDAANCEVHWVDVGVSYYGLGDVATMTKGLMEAIPDLEVLIEEVAARGSKEVEVWATVSGTQVHRFLPLFPCGRSARWRVRSSVRFDDALKIKYSDLAFQPYLGRNLEPSAISGMAESALLLAATASGSRILQAGIQAATGDCQEHLLDELRGHVWSMSASPHGNHVLQKFISTAPPPFASFIIEEFRGRAAVAAQHNTRSRILERLLEHCTSEQTAPLVEELLSQVVALARQPFGNFVVQRLLEHGTPAQRHSVAVALAPHVVQLARHRQANNVVRCLIMHCIRPDKEMVLRALSCAPKGLAGLASHIAGSFVVRELKLAGLLGNCAGETDLARSAQAASSSRLEK